MKVRKTIWLTPESLLNVTQEAETKGISAASLIEMILRERIQEQPKTEATNEGTR